VKIKSVGGIRSNRALDYLCFKQITWEFGDFSKGDGEKLSTPIFIFIFPISRSISVNARIL